MTPVKRCLLAVDPTVPPDHKGRRYCTCGALADHPRHNLPDTTEADAEQRRRVGERNEP